MTRKRTTRAEAVPIRVVIVTLDGHLAGAVERARALLVRQLPGLELSLHVAADWRSDPEALERCRADIEQGDIVIAHMLFMEEHIEPVMPWLERRRDACDAMIGCMSAESVVKLTRMGRFKMETSEYGLIARLKKLRGTKKKNASTGARQMAMLRRIPQLLRFVPGTAQDIRAYFLTMQYWLAGSHINAANMVRFLIDRYADGPRRVLRGKLKPKSPVEYPEVGVYHPRLEGGIGSEATALPEPPDGARGTVGLLVMRSYVLAGSTAHYDGVIDALEARGLRVVPIFASGLDARPAIERFFFDEGRVAVDCVVSLTGFSLVGGPAYSDSDAAAEMLARLDVPYLSAHAVEFQSLEEWESSDAGLLPIEATMMVAIPELDGATGPLVYGGRSAGPSRRTEASHDMQAHPERAAMLAARVARLVELRRTPTAERRVAVVLFAFPPNAGNLGTAMGLSVFESLHRTLVAMRDEGYAVELPSSVEELRDRILASEEEGLGAPGRVHARVAADDHVRREPWLEEIEAQWGPAPGRQLSDGSSLLVLGASFGNVFVGVQPGFGYEGDPMRLLFEKGFAPTHAFSAFYRYLREDFGAHALLHFGTHGALEFMPGKQVGLSGDCWPDRLLGEVPNFYLYAANNPSEGTIAKRRSAATLVSYRTPPISEAGLYRDLHELRTSIDRWRSLPPDARDGRDGTAGEGAELLELIHEQAAAVDLVSAKAEQEACADTDAEATVARIMTALDELEQTLIPHGLHVVGDRASAEERQDLLLAVTQASHEPPCEAAWVEALVGGATPERVLANAGRAGDAEALEKLRSLAGIDRQLERDSEIPGLLRALAGRFVPPAPGGDLLRTPDVLPTGRNLHGFDPLRLPSAIAMRQGARQADRLLARHAEDGHGLPESVALVLWGSDNLKTEGASLSQALALLGARPRFDSYGRLCGAELVPLSELGRPRIDVVITLSGIFRDLFPIQTRVLAEAAFLAAEADEPLEENFVRRNTLAHQAAEGCDFETAALRVFSNAQGAYGANVSQLVQNDLWDEEDELAEAYSRRKAFAYGRSGEPVRQSELLERVLAGADLAYQNLDSVEVGVTTVDVYFDNLGGISRSIQRARGEKVPVYIADETQNEGRVRTLAEQVALESRTRTLNPKWYEGMLRHGFEGVSQIEAQVTNTMGWSATTGQVDDWVYRQLASTFVLDDAMRERLAALNPTASAKLANRLIEAHERAYWSPAPETLDALRRAGAELEDRLEGIDPGVAA